MTGHSKKKKHHGNIFPSLSYLSHPCPSWLHRTSVISLSTTSSFPCSLPVVFPHHVSVLRYEIAAVALPSMYSAVTIPFDSSFISARFVLHSGECCWCCWITIVVGGWVSWVVGRKRAREIERYNGGLIETDSVDVHLMRQCYRSLMILMIVYLMITLESVLSHSAIPGYSIHIWNYNAIVILYLWVTCSTHHWCILLLHVHPISSTILKPTSSSVSIDWWMRVGKVNACHTALLRQRPIKSLD